MLADIETEPPNHEKSNQDLWVKFFYAVYMVQKLCP